MIFYKKRRKYKYTLVKEYTQIIDIQPSKLLGKNSFLKLGTDGTLTIKKGYSWDGPSGPTYDTKNFMQGSLVHDAIYQLMREKKLPYSYRKYADQLLRDMCTEDGMSRLRVFYVYWSVRLFAAKAAKPDTISAP